MRLFILFFIAILLTSCDTTPEYASIDGVLEVPENRANPNSRTLQLVYKILKAKKLDSTKAPIVYLQGGPGAATLIMEEYWKNHPLRDDRDVILMDQRGTGESAANCINVGQAIFKIIRRDLDAKGEELALDSIFNKCKNTLKKKEVDLAGYNSRENAADFEDLRKVLGYEKWNLYGASYGTRLGLTIMRDFPKSIRSSTFIGVFPPEIGLFGDLILNFENSLFEVLAQCKLNDKCNERYPDLKNRLFKTLNKLKTQPLQLNYDSEVLVLNYRDALLILHQSLYSSYSIAYIPNIIEALEQGYSEPIINALKRVEFIYSLVNWPMNNSIMAYEELPFFNSAEMDEILKKSQLGFDVATFEGLGSLSNWHSFRADDLENESVVSDIPTLLISGGLDPVTPPSNVNGALINLKNGRHVIFKNESHDIYNPCFLKISEEFINDPYKSPDINCSKEGKQIAWFVN
ncbi:alpha/beta fold hydrolase [Maribacter sp. PR1]|uniref:Proline iminopeptidase n=1 Tax=Maribacter cobaltidurans TaxID=1178778 RepID=A0ABU7ISD0_9FLAO|nr:MULTISPECIES: alpha/beta fold hydrolase [Maribacter]MDC6388048.1 alpha/beta fold hydrolase [Maribacter sp. PR1]MEE1975436.1 alpha/beta fold hydrolase [Maribacter cobaltidurans]